ncbi:hypothetical protein TWF696_008770 [Orbilia brochopaga]|uniref:Uncharacterized protein n=1 Tax=Orbilia brochopaga TaxID=3140254 RepID=A0AAV9UHX6_9PEZI
MHRPPYPASHHRCQRSDRSLLSACPSGVIRDDIYSFLRFKLLLQLWSNTASLPASAFFSFSTPSALSHPLVPAEHSTFVPPPPTTTTTLPPRLLPRL